MGEENLKEEIARLREELEKLRRERANAGQMVKRKTEVAGGITDEGVFQEEVRRTVFSGGFEREEVKVTSYFSVRGHPLERDRIYRCSFCGIVLTEDEKIEVNKRVYCENCYRREEHDLERDDYKILICISRGITSTSLLLEHLGCGITIQRVTGITKEEVERRIRKLLERGYLFLHGLIFKELRISSKGEEALVAYRQIYRDPDILLVMERARGGAWR